MQVTEWIRSAFQTIFFSSLFVGFQFVSWITRIGIFIACLVSKNHLLFHERIVNVQKKVPGLEPEAFRIERCTLLWFLPLCCVRLFPSYHHVRTINSQDCPSSTSQRAAKWAVNSLMSSPPKQCLTFVKLIKKFCRKLISASFFHLLEIMTSSAPPPPHFTGCDRICTLCISFSFIPAALVRVLRLCFSVPPKDCSVIQQYFKLIRRQAYFHRQEHCCIYQYCKKGNFKSAQCTLKES
jgi:hypothetical protein